MLADLHIPSTRFNAYVVADISDVAQGVMLTAEQLSNRV
jgi:hypothetical protein